jgi:hypothetical protein
MSLVIRDYAPIVDIKVGLFGGGPSRDRPRGRLLRLRPAATRAGH